MFSGDGGLEKLVLVATADLFHPLLDKVRNIILGEFKSSRGLLNPSLNSYVLMSCRGFNFTGGADVAVAAAAVAAACCC